MSKYLIVGLGNPGQEYAETRHNAGWLTVEALAKRANAGFREERSLHTLLADLRIDSADTDTNEGVEHIGHSQQALLSLPTTYMNESGRAVQAVAQYFKIPLTQILIVQDELDFPLGRLAFRDGGNAGGHNGVDSIYEQTGATQFARLRLGIGRPPTPQASKDYVLEKFSTQEKEKLAEILTRGADAIEFWLQHGLTKSMNVWNGSIYDAATESTSPLGSGRLA